MIRNRLMLDMDAIRLPKPPDPEPSPSAFALYPMGIAPGADPVGWLCQQAVYQWAFQEAQAVVRPSILERDLLGVWN